MKLSLHTQAKLQNILITDEHSARLPVVRITKIVLQDFKNVEYGEIDFHCGKYFVPYGTQADILGLYGQNGELLPEQILSRFTDPGAVRFFYETGEETVEYLKHVSVEGGLLKIRTAVKGQ